MEEVDSERDLRKLLIETAMRARIGFPQTKQQDRWFKEGLVKNSEFMERLFNELDAKANENEGSYGE